MQIPVDLVHKMQGDYVASKYKDGVYTFLGLDEQTILVLVKSFIEWADSKKLVKDEKIDISSFYGR